MSIRYGLIKVSSCWAIGLLSLVLFFIESVTGYSLNQSRSLLVSRWVSFFFCFCCLKYCCFLFFFKKKSLKSWIFLLGFIFWILIRARISCRLRVKEGMVCFSELEEEVEMFKLISLNLIEAVAICCWNA